MALQTQNISADDPKDGSRKEYWCNFCDYTTDGLDEYLAHSCIDTLKEAGKTVESTGQNECR